MSIEDDSSHPPSKSSNFAMSSELLQQS